MKLLVFEPPKNCSECCFVTDEYGFFNNPYCGINNAWVRDYIFGEERPPICPLVDYKEVKDERRTKNPSKADREIRVCVRRDEK